MNTNTRLFADLQKLVTLEPGLMDQLKDAKSLDQAIGLTIAAAKNHEITLDADELRAMLQAVDSRTPAREMSDDQLAGVAGGDAFNFIREFLELIFPSPPRPIERRIPIR